MGSVANAVHREPWNKGKIVGQKAPFKLKDIWALRVRLQMESRVRELALFNLGIDSKLRGCDLVSLKVRGDVLSWASLEGVKLAKQGAATGLIPKSFPSVAELLKTFSENGGRIGVCPPCAKTHGVTRQPD